MEHLLVVGIAHSIFTAVFLATKPNTSPSDKVLATWMVFIALPMIGGASVQMWPNLRIPVLQADLIYPLTYGPFLWLYVRSLTEETFGLHRRDLVHFTPFALISVVQLSIGWAPAPPNPEDTQFDLTTRIIGAANLLVMTGYSSVVANRLLRHRQAVVEHFSALPNQVTLTWLYWLAIAIPAVLSVLFIAASFSLPALLPIYLPAQIAIILAMSYFGLLQTKVFESPKGTPLAPATETNDVTVQDTPAGQTGPQDTKEQYSKSGLSEERADFILNRLETFMAKEKPYLSPDLTIAELAKKLAVQRHHLTEVISTRYQKNFYVFVNEYRIEAVKQALIDPQNAQTTLIDVAYACGFNSKAPFNAAFKRLTGVTPSQFRARLA
ncbi:MAG: AraC family transcriptional regulator [Thalassovita sp.]